MSSFIVAFKRKYNFIKILLNLLKSDCHPSITILSGMLFGLNVKHEFFVRKTDFFKKF